MSQTSMIYTITDEEIPGLEIINKIDGPVSTAEPLVATALVTGPPHTEAHWESVVDQPDKFEPFDLSSVRGRRGLNQPLIITGSANNKPQLLHLLIPKNSLKPGSSYMFKAVASSDRSGQKAVATFVVKTLPAPSDDGQVTVSRFNFRKDMFLKGISKRNRLLMYW